MIYIERLGVMYMLKLRYDDFGSYAGTCWRMLFVYALMPWMRKYRKSEDNIRISDFKFAANRMWTGRMPPSKKEFRDDKTSGKSIELSNLEGSEDSKETETLITTLKQQNSELKKESHLMRHLLFQPKSGIQNIISNSCPPGMFTGPHPLD